MKLVILVLILLLLYAMPDLFAWWGGTEPVT